MLAEVRMAWLGQFLPNKTSLMNIKKQSIRCVYNKLGRLFVIFSIYNLSVALLAQVSQGFKAR